MAEVYSNAQLCIAASRAVDCDAGFLHPRKKKNWQHVHVEDAYGAFHLYIARGKARLDPEDQLDWKPRVSSLEIVNDPG